MAWDIERTKARLLAAATKEFSAKGLAGARVDNIASAAGVNKERIYQYFVNKDGLFDAVLAAAVGSALSSIDIRGQGPNAVGEYAGLLLDSCARDSTVLRLLFWEGLERGDDVVDRKARSNLWESKVDDMLRVLPGIRRAYAADLLLSIFTICGGWNVLPQMESLLVTDPQEKFTRRRALIVSTVTTMASTLGEGTTAAVNRSAAVPIERCQPGD